MSERERLLELLRVHGWAATSFMTLEAGYRYWFDDEAEAAIAYVDTGSAWVTAGPPVGATEVLEASLGRFCAAAARVRRRVALFGVEERFRKASSFVALRIGEQPVWEPRRFAERARADRTLRSQLKRARNKGVSARAIAPAELEAGTRLRAQVDALIEQWLSGRRSAPLGFLVRVEPFDHAAERRFVVAEHGGEVVGLAVAVPIYARRGWLVEDLVRLPSAPNGTSELLVEAMMTTLAEEDCAFVTLGLSPLHGPIARWLRLAGSLGSTFYEFRGLAAFKEKLRPDLWEPVYVAHPRKSWALRVLLDGLVAFTEGSLLAFAWRSLVRRLRARTPPRPEPKRLPCP